MKAEDLTGYRSLASHAAGEPTTRVMHPTMRKAQGSPSLRIIESDAILSVAPPRPPPALTRHCARPSLVLNNRLGTRRKILRHKQLPILVISGKEPPKVGRNETNKDLSCGEEQYINVIRRPNSRRSHAPARPKIARESNSY